MRRLPPDGPAVDALRVVGHRERPEVHVPQVEGEQFPAGRLTEPGNNLDDLHGGQAAHRAGHRAEHREVERLPLRVAVGEHAAQARVAGQHRQQLGLGVVHGREDQRHPQVQAHPVDPEPFGEVVAGVDYHVRAGDETGQERVEQVPVPRLDRDGRVVLPQRAGGAGHP